MRTARFSHRAPDVRLAGNGRLYETLRSGRFVLLGPENDAGKNAVDGWADRVEHAPPAGNPGTVTIGTVTPGIVTPGIVTPGIVTLAR